MLMHFTRYSDTIDYTLYKGILFLIRASFGRGIGRVGRGGWLPHVQVPGKTFQPIVQHGCATKADPSVINT